MKKILISMFVVLTIGFISSASFAGGPSDNFAPSSVNANVSNNSTESEAMHSHSQLQLEGEDSKEPPVVRSQEQPFTEKDFGNTELGRAAFAQMLQNLMPLSPRQIITLRKLFDDTQRAVAKYPGTPPRPTSSSIMVSMSPGSTPPIIRLRAGYVTSLVFLDSTGAPWPITAYDLGDPKHFNMQPTTPDGKTNTLIVQTSSPYISGNLAVMLKGEDTPVMITLMSGQRAVDYRVDLRIPGLGPNAVIALNGLPPTENPKLLNFLDGVPPTGAKRLQVEGAPAQAWLYFNHVFLRTRVTLLSPGWISSVSSPDGTHVFEIDKTPVILASQRGKMIHMFIKGL